MILMKSPTGAYMNCYNPREVSVAESKGWVVADKEPEAKKTRKPRSDAGKPRVKK